MPAMNTRLHMERDFQCDEDECDAERERGSLSLLAHNTSLLIQPCYAGSCLRWCRV